MRSRERRSQRAAGVHRLLPYGVAGFSVAAALAINLAIAPWYGSAVTPVLLCVLSTMVSAWYGGIGPGLLAGTLSALALRVLPPAAPEPVDLGLFALGAAAVSVIVGALRRASRRAEVARSEAEASNRELIDFMENASVGLHWVGADGCLIWANKTELEMLGYARDEYIGHQIAEFHADWAVLSDITERLANNETLHNYEARLRCKDGSIKHVLISSDALCKEGQFVHHRCYTRDISERKRVEEALHRLIESTRAPGGALFEALVRALAETLKVRYAFVARFEPGDPERARTLAVWANGERGDEFDYELVGTPCEDVLEQQSCFHPSGVAGQFPRDPLLARLRAESFLAAPLRASDGRALGLLVVLHDQVIDEKLQPEAMLLLFAGQAAAGLEREVGREALRQARADAEATARRAAFLAEASAVLSSSLDYQTTLASVARLAVPFLADWCSIDMVEFDGSIRRISIAHADPSKADLAHEMAVYPPDREGKHPRTRVLHTGRSEFAPEVTDEHLVAAAGSPQQLAVMRQLGYRSSMIVALVARGQTLGAMTFATAESGRVYEPRDLALAEELARRAALAVDNARLYQEATGANRTKDDFLAMLSHELRSPLSAILTWAELLRSGKLDEAKTARALGTIQRNARLQVRLIEDLLDISRIDAGKLNIEMSRVALRSVIEAAAEMVRGEADAKGIQLRLELDSALTTVRGDPARLQQIIGNLLSNSVKFTPAGGHVVIRSRQVDGLAEVAVEDSGIGIAADLLPHIFERFQQADGSITRKHGGLGLGLAIVRHLVELHRGTVRAASPGVNQGATFTIRLPLAPTTEAETASRTLAAAAGEESSLSGSPLRGLRLLVVDDDADAREFLSAVLIEAGAEVVPAASVPAAIAAYEIKRPDVVLTDLAMPDEDGFGLLGRVRALGVPDGKRMPVIAVTALAGPEDRRRTLIAGFDLHLTKPVTPTEVVAAVVKVVPSVQPPDVVASGR